MPNPKNSRGGSSLVGSVVKKCRGRRGVWDFVLSILVRGAGAPLAFAGNVLLARLLGPNDFGLYMTLLSVGLVAGNIAAYGLGPVLTRELSTKEGTEQATATTELGAWALRFGSLSSSLAIALTLVWLASGFGSPASNWPEKLSALAIIPFFVLSAIVSGMLAGL